MSVAALMVRPTVPSSSTAESSTGASGRQRMYAREAPLGTHRINPQVVRNRASLPLCSFSAHRSPYLYSSVTPNGCYTVGSPSKAAQRRQQRQGIAPCPVTAPPRMDSRSRRGFNEFDEQQRVLVRQAWRAFDKDVVEPAQREALLDELLILSPTQFAGQLAQLQKSRRAQAQASPESCTSSSPRDTSTRRLPSRPSSALSSGTGGGLPLSPYVQSHRGSPPRSTTASDRGSALAMTPTWASVSSRDGVSPSSGRLRTPHRPGKFVVVAPTPHVVRVPAQAQVEGQGEDGHARRGSEPVISASSARPPHPRRATSAMPRELAAAAMGPSQPHRPPPLALSPRHFVRGSTSSSSPSMVTMAWSGTAMAAASSSSAASSPNARAWSAETTTRLHMAPPAVSRGIGALCPSTFAPIAAIPLDGH